jgi:transcriptional regulator
MTGTLGVPGARRRPPNWTVRPTMTLHDRHQRWEVIRDDLPDDLDLDLAGLRAMRAATAETWTGRTPASRIVSMARRVNRGGPLRHDVSAHGRRAQTMYVPSAFAETDTARLHEFMRRHSFAVLTSHGERGLFASHLPLLLDADDGPHGTLLGHMARANPQWRDARGEAMAVFSGPHAYVSPSWYGEAGTVPTWNYVAVHAYGAFHVVEHRDGLLDILRRSVLAYEGPRAEPWTIDESGPHVEGLLRAIVGFRIHITRLEGKWKLGQNHPEGRRRKVIRGLAAEPTEDAKAIAQLMEETLR